ncbi:DUF1127 domain-containing protein [Rhizobium lentis]|uniref:DUF1127 domain-containing protein n=1 Tax=Rhizobium lentis TaxID=1138194 RepID=UPI001A911F9A|nr:DUF1127 domain-containing protein [Rhizobium lentis]MBX4956198.1 DUF1127 domain-containing protein [Rhizobium lentis]MBX4974600.1 DUF1127 domain-containing protein [Rhizobium lentis]MBX4985895.1 DUF1127 domain-containing protein [Rhizobium lentis]MBX5004339.1 DUF1127 domain-containing protein [Rhizobium lentis]MBX5009838.1 DUF1127 domain-containing protein [Rhizobium lentis]
MAATKHFGHVELQSPHLGVVRSLQAVWMLLKHQRRSRRNLSELSRLDSRLLRDIGLEWLPPRPDDQRAGKQSEANKRHYQALVTQSSKQLSPDKQNWQHFFALCRNAVSNCD